MAEWILFWSATTFYAVATTSLFVWLAFRRPVWMLVGLATATVGLAPHAAAIALRWSSIGHGPFTTSYEVLSSNTWLALLVFASMAWRRAALRPLGVVVLPAAFLAMGWAVTTYDVATEAPIIFRSTWLYLHIGFAKLFFAFALLCGASAAGILLRNRYGARLAMLPEPSKLEDYGHQFLLVSFLCLGVMIIAGSLWAHQSWGRYWAWDPIETSALASWIAYGAILHARALHRWSGRRMALLHLAALAIAIFTLYVVVLVLPSIHNFYMRTS